MKKNIFLLFLTLFACQQQENSIIYNRTCITTQHHELIIGNIDVYIKYNATDFNFPGWEDLAEYDTAFAINSTGSGCIDNLPIGKHWVAGLGFDDKIQRSVKGRMFIHITFEHPEIDTVLYIGEE